MEGSASPTCWKTVSPGELGFGRDVQSEARRLRLDDRRARRPSTGVHRLHQRAGVPRVRYCLRAVQG